MKHCLNCKIEIDLVGDFCSTRCNDEWQLLKQNCITCKKEIDLLEDEFKIINDGQDPKMMCKTCYDKDNT